MNTATGTPARDTELDDARLARLLRGCGAGQTADLEELYKSMAPRLLGQLVTMLGDRAQAEDALQEVFIKVWDRARQFDSARGRPVTWLMSVARYHAIDLLRSRRVTVPIDDLQLALASEEPGWSSQESGQTAARLADCLGQLSGDQRRCIKLAYIGGHSQEQIATALQSPLGSVKSWIRRALLSLRECMGP
ncbi:MAG: sigma-70 family RNA polymerase sigma factor [Pseudomonadota bacterium]